VGASSWRREKEERGGPGAAVGSAGRPTMAPNRRVWAAPLQREQRRAAGVDYAAMRANAADEWDRGEAGLGVSGRGAGESGKKRPSGDGAPIGGPGQHSAGWRGLNSV
jgi:hypothetical protein